MPSPKDHPSLPIPVSYISGHYLLFSAQALSYLRTVHAVQGLQVGTLPQVPQQNTFRGLPVELMPAEVNVLLEKGVVEVVNDLDRHENGVVGGKLEKRRRFLEQNKGAVKSQSLDTDAVNSEHPGLSASTTEEKFTSTADRQENMPSLSQTAVTSSAADKLSHTPSITPDFLLSALPLTVLPIENLPISSSAGALISHINKVGYTVGPGMQYGAEYVAYPGPPEATHSHLLIKPMGQTEEFSLRDIIGITRLGNSVQKIFTVGGLVEGTDGMNGEGLEVFTFEWAGF